MASAWKRAARSQHPQLLHLVTSVSLPCCIAFTGPHDLIKCTHASDSSARCALAHQLMVLPAPEGCCPELQHLRRGCGCGRCSGCAADQAQADLWPRAARQAAQAVHVTPGARSGATAGHLPGLQLEQPSWQQQCLLLQLQAALYGGPLLAQSCQVRQVGLLAMRLMLAPWLEPGRVPAVVAQDLRALMAAKLAEMVRELIELPPGLLALGLSCQTALASRLLAQEHQRVHVLLLAAGQAAELLGQGC